MNKFPALVPLLLAVFTVQAAEPVRLENDRLTLHFDAVSGTLVTVQNKLAAESYEISGDEFAVEAVEFNLAFADVQLVSLQCGSETLEARYRALA